MWLLTMWLAFVVGGGLMMLVGMAMQYDKNRKVK